MYLRLSFRHQAPPEIDLARPAVQTRPAITARPELFSGGHIDEAMPQRPCIRTKQQAFELILLSETHLFLERDRLKLCHTPPPSKHPDTTLYSQFVSNSLLS